jgi:methionine synthase II (cobalamin-independent)
MPPILLSAGLATGIGSLPHRDPLAAAASVLQLHPGLPAAPQLPVRTPLEGMIAQWARALPEVVLAADGTIERIDLSAVEAPIVATFDDIAHGGLLAFLALAAQQPQPPAFVKVQLTGPLTLGIALTAAGVPAPMAFDRAGLLARAWARALEHIVAERLPASSLVLFFDEPGLVAFRDGQAPIDRERATDLLSGALAAVACTVGVHVCGQGDLRIALDAGPQILGVETSSALLAHAAALGRHMEGDGWIAWGAVPTDRPVGEQAAPLWKNLVECWCELTRRGCDGVRLRRQALVTPACGLAGHGISQAERAMKLAREIGFRIHDQSVATKLTVGA